MKCDNNQEFQILVSPEYKVREGDLFFVLVEEKDLQRFNELEDRNE